MRISDEDARALGRLIHGRVRELKITDSQAAARAERALSEDAPRGLAIPFNYVAKLRQCPRQPLSNPEARFKFAAVVEALWPGDVEARGRANRLAGGI